jgi:hypothetical protein
MNNEKQEYLLLFRGSNNWYKELSPEELQKVMAKVGAWFESLNAKGIVKGGQPLGAGGRVITGKGNNLVISDGPFAESKETIGGYTIIVAGSLDEATEIAKGVPLLLSGGTVEVRPIAEECPMMAHAREVFGEKQFAGTGV